MDPVLRQLNLIITLTLFLRSILILSFHLCLYFPNGPFLHTKIYNFFIIAEQEKDEYREGGKTYHVTYHSLFIRCNVTLNP